VDRDSATGYAARPTSIDTSHAGLNKFHNTEDRGYVELKAAIEQLRVKSVLEQADDYIREKCYTASMLQIERLSGETLLMEQCYINLALVAQIQTGTTTQHIPNDDGTALRSSPFSLFARQKVETTAEQIQIRLAEVFQPRQNFNGTEMVPRKILIRGRAGVGKTTLCKKMVHEFKTNTMWSDLFDRVLWIPLRNLKSETDTKYGLRDFFDHEYFQFSGQDKLEGSTRFAKEIHDALKLHRTLFILDGWDELAEIDKKSYMFRFLKELLHQSNVIITTRPSATLPDGIKLDLELETTGFSPAQVDEYIVKVHKDDADELRLFLQAHELMAGLVRIPILLDAFCYCWNNIGRTFEETPQTMTTLYQTIETSLWKKDIVRLDKEKTQNLAEVEQRQIETQFIEHELHFLEHLAFTGMVVDKIEFSLEDRRKANLDSGQRLLLDKTLPCLSFLRTSAPQAKSEHRLYHFIHLTFQEYFAARCFVQQWRSKPNFECFAVGHKKLSPNGFLRRYKYDARYDIMWRFVAGLLDDKGEEEIVGFFKKIKSEPVDLLGPTHQRLIMHCLDEAVCLSSGPYRMRMEGRLSQWLLFECSFRGSASLASESEFPDNALHNALQICTGRDRVTILQALNSRGRCISRDTLAVVTTLLQDQESHVRSAAARAIDGQPNLPESAIAALIPLLQDKQRHVRFCAAEAIRGQPNLPESAIAALIPLLQHKESDVRYAAARVIGSQSKLPESAIATLIALLQHEKGYVRSEAAEAIGGQSNVLDQLLEASRVVLISESSTSTTESVSCHSSFIECLYRPLLWRSFREQSSLYVDGNHYFVNQQSGLRRIARVHGDTSQCEAAQKSVNPSEFDLWGAIENTEEL
jgi:GTPase SAR1 family protein